MGSNIRLAAGSLALALLALLMAFAVRSADGVAAVRGCGSFASQAEAQEYFIEQDGGPSRPIGALDPDRDGVACEGLPGPYEGYATIGYNLAKRFFYGIATMPPEASGGEGFACLYGNRHFPDAARRLDVYRVKPGPDEPLFGNSGVGAEVDQASGRLLWRADRVLNGPGRYYAAFEERIPLAPYGKNECPGFKSYPALLGPGARP
jgi:hypothetical protein